MSSAQLTIPEYATPRARVSFAAAYALWLAVVLLGLAAVDDAARAGQAWAGPLFWVALLAIFLPAAGRLCLRETPDGEGRLGVLMLLGLALYGVELLHSPSQFSFHDELVTLRSLHDLGATGRLFTPNPVVKAFSLYPGIDLATLATGRVSGLGAFPAGVIVIGAQRLVMVVALYELFRAATSSARVAGIAVLVYVANPNFVFFDAQFSYESFALPLAVMTLALVARALRERDPSHRRGLLWLAALTAIAVAPSHHITSYALGLTLLCWSGVLLLRHRHSPASNWTPVAIVAVTSVSASLLWLIAVGRSTSEYLSPVLGGAGDAAVNLLTGSGAGKAPFQSPGGPSNSPLERVLAFASVLALLALLVVEVWRLRRSRPSSAIGAVLVLAALLYPFTLFLRLTQAGTETSNRASECVFLGLAFVVAPTLSSFASSEPRSRVRAVLAACALGVFFLGGIVIGQAPASRLPGGPLVEADPRSVEPYDLAAARWAAAHLPVHSRIVADRANALLMAAYALQDPQVGTVDDLHLASLITSPVFGTDQRRIISQDAIAYVVVDDRLSRERPVVGYYVEQNEPGAFAYRVPLAVQAITKFESEPELQRIFSDGHVSIYATTVSRDPRSAR